MKDVLEAACRRLGREPVEPVLMLSRDEQILSPLALKLGLDPQALLGQLPGRVVAGMLVLEPDQIPVPGPLIGLPPRWAAFFRTVAPGPGELTPDDLPLLRYLHARRWGLGTAARLEELLDRSYRSQLPTSARARLWRAVLGDLLEKPGTERLP